MNIAIDCRYIGKSGIGRVCRGLLEGLDFSANKYYLIGKREQLGCFAGAEIIEDETEPYSAGGLLKFNKKRINRECDCLIIPNFLVPFGIKIPVHTVIHDLIFLDIKITCRNFADRAIKKYLLKRCIKKSATAACVSAFTLSRCRHYYKKRADKCYVAYQGLSQSLAEYTASRTLPAAKQDKIVFVGNVKPHKGLKTLLEAFEKTQGLTLRIIGERENFLTGLDIDEGGFEKVEFTGRLPDEEMFGEVASAKYLVLPSQYEGFGIPPLEAICLGTQPIVSDIPVFREVYDGLPAVFFNGAEELAALMERPPARITGDDVKRLRERYDYKRFADAVLCHAEGRNG